MVADPEGTIWCGILSVVNNRGPLRHKLVLVVDDDRIIADSLVTILNQCGFAAYAAYDGESAFKAALLAPPRVVISDVMMKDMNGISLGIAIRRAFPNCKVVLMSGVSAVHSLIASATSGGEQFVFLQKPVRPEVLLKLVEEGM